MKLASADMHPSARQPARRPSLAVTSSRSSSRPLTRHKTSEKSSNALTERLPASPGKRSFVDDNSPDGTAGGGQGRWRERPPRPLLEADRSRRAAPRGCLHRRHACLKCSPTLRSWMPICSTMETILPRMLATLTSDSADLVVGSQDVRPRRKRRSHSRRNVPRSAAPQPGLRAEDSRRRDRRSQAIRN